MEITHYLKHQEGKILEFKENCQPLPKILQTVVAFANSAGGTLIIGVRDKTKEVVGLPDPLKDEESLCEFCLPNGIRSPFHRGGLSEAPRSGIQTRVVKEKNNS